MIAGVVVAVVVVALIGIIVAVGLFMRCIWRRNRSMKYEVQFDIKVDESRIKDNFSSVNTDADGLTDLDT